MVANVSLLFRSAIKQVFYFPFVFSPVLWGGGILSSHGTETRSRGAERCTRRQVLSLRKKCCPRHTHFSLCFLQLEHRFYYPVWSSCTEVLNLNTPLKYPEASWSLISLQLSHSHELIWGLMQSRRKAARLLAGSGGTWDRPGMFPGACTSQAR